MLKYTLLTIQPSIIYNAKKLYTKNDLNRIKQAPYSLLKPQKSQDYIIKSKSNLNNNNIKSNQKTSIKDITKKIIPILTITFGIYLINTEPVKALSLLFKTEVSNELSIPTWMIHISSVIEWMTAMWLVWQYAEVTGNSKWKGMTWGMFPCLISALCACTWHYFYNAPELEYLVTVQAFMTVVGNVTCWIAAYRLYKSSIVKDSI